MRDVLVDNDFSRDCPVAKFFIKAFGVETALNEQGAHANRLGFGLAKLHEIRAHLLPSKFFEDGDTAELIRLRIKFLEAGSSNGNVVGVKNEMDVFFRTFSKVFLHSLFGHKNLLPDFLGIVWKARTEAGVNHVAIIM